MLLLDFINVGNGDATLLREVEDGVLKYAVLVDCGHDRLQRDDHPEPLDPRSQRIFAGDFLEQCGVKKLDLLILTHFHRDHVGGLARVLQKATVDTLAATYIPPETALPFEPDADPAMPKAARNALRCLNFYVSALHAHGAKIREKRLLTGEQVEDWPLTDALSLRLLFSDTALYRRQKELYDAVLSGKRDAYALIRWAKCMNISAVRQRFCYHGREIVLGSDVYAHMWEKVTATPCDILKLPHHGSLASTTRKLLDMLPPKTVVISEAAGRPDERPHPYTISLVREFTQDLHFTDAVSIPGLVDPVFHRSVHLEIP